MRSLRNSRAERWALLEGPGKHRSLAIFVHGYLGNYLTTWGDIPDRLRESADADPDFKNWDYLFVGYSTRRIGTYLDVAALIATNWRKAKLGQAPFRRRYDRLALIGHSLGTLGIRQLLCAGSIHPSNFLKDLRSVTLFGSPINGSLLAFVAPFTIANALTPGNPQLLMLRTWTATSFGHAKWKPVHLIVGLGDNVVGSRPSWFVDWAGDGRGIDYTNLGHGRMKTPQEWEDSSIFGYLKRALK